MEVGRICKVDQSRGRVREREGERERGREGSQIQQRKRGFREHHRKRLSEREFFFFFLKEGTKQIGPVSSLPSICGWSVCVSVCP